MMWVSGLFTVGMVFCVAALVLLGRDNVTANGLVRAQREEIVRLIAEENDYRQREAVQAKQVTTLKDHLRAAAAAMETTALAPPPKAPPPAAAPSAPTPALPTDPYARMEDLLQRPPKTGG